MWSEKILRCDLLTIMGILTWDLWEYNISKHIHLII